MRSSSGEGDLSRCRSRSSCAAAAIDCNSAWCTFNRAQLVATSAAHRGLTRPRRESAGRGNALCVLTAADVGMEGDGAVHQLHHCNLSLSAAPLLLLYFFLVIFLR